MENVSYYYLEECFEIIRILSVDSNWRGRSKIIAWFQQWHWHNKMKHLPAQSAQLLSHRLFRFFQTHSKAFSLFDKGITWVGKTPAGTRRRNIGHSRKHTGQENADNCFGTAWIFAGRQFKRTLIWRMAEYASLPLLSSLVAKRPPANHPTNYNHRVSGTGIQNPSGQSPRLATQMYYSLFLA